MTARIPFTMVVLFSAYAVLWFLCLFFLLPWWGWSVTLSSDSGDRRVNPMLRERSLTRQAVSLVDLGGFYAAIGSIGFDALEGPQTKMPSLWGSVLGILSPDLPFFAVTTFFYWGLVIE